MNDETEIVSKVVDSEVTVQPESGPSKTSTVSVRTGGSDESRFGTVSVRALIALTIAWTLCACAIFQIKIEEPFYSASLITIGFFFGQKKQ